MGVVGAAGVVVGVAGAEGVVGVVGVPVTVTVSGSCVVAVGGGASVAGRVVAPGTEALSTGFVARLDVAGGLGLHPTTLSSAASTPETARKAATTAKASFLVMGAIMPRCYKTPLFCPVCCFSRLPFLLSSLRMVVWVPDDQGMMEFFL